MATKATVQLIDGDEIDAVEDQQHFRFKAGVRKAIKRKINHRIRTHVRAQLRDGRYDD